MKFALFNKIDSKTGFIAGLCALVISGYGGSTDSAQMAAPPNLPTFAAANTGYLTANQWAAAVAQSTDLSEAINRGAINESRPAVAAATLNGYMFANTQRNGLVGKMTLNANFTDNTITGTVNNLSGGPLTENTLENLDGELTLSNGIISGDGFDADLTGAMTSNVGTTTVAATMDGLFFETQGRIVTDGSISGGIVAPNGVPSDIQRGYFLALE